MDRATAIFVEGMGAASATSGVLTQLQGRIFALIYLHARHMSLDEIVAELQQSKSNVSVSIRGLVDWHLVRRVPVAGSRKDHYEAATDFWRVMQEIMERRFRWNLRQVLATVDETRRAVDEDARAGGTKLEATLTQRLDTLGAFAAAVDTAIRAFGEGQSVEAEHVQRALLAVTIQEGRSSRRRSS